MQADSASSPAVTRDLGQLWLTQGSMHGSYLVNVLGGLLLTACCMPGWNWMASVCLASRRGCVLVRPPCGSVLRADEPILEALIELAGKLMPDRESCHGLGDGDAMRAG